MGDEKYCFSCGAIINKEAEICPKCGVNQLKRTATLMQDVHCFSCGEVIKKEAEICPKCGVRQFSPSQPAHVTGGDLNDRWLTILLLSIFLGGFGGHQFYAGKGGKGAAMLVLSLAGWITCWFVVGIFALIGVFIWQVIDIVNIATQKFSDKSGNIYYRHTSN
jgi:RNA polymerase subunit RPABC4/transcription elongation factor Spt4/TM2 domain-containing membrane protein YozV